MTLQWTDIEIPFAQGLAGKEAQKSTQGPLLLENVNFDELGALNKRPKYTPIAFGSNNYGRAIISRGNFSIQYVYPSTDRMHQLWAYNTARAAFAPFADWDHFRVSVDKTVMGSPPAYADMRTLDCILDSAGTTRVFYATQSYLSGTTFDPVKIITKDTTTKQTLETATLSAVSSTSGRFVRVGPPGLGSDYGHVFVYRIYSGALAGIGYITKPTAQNYWNTTNINVTAATTASAWSACYWGGANFAVIWLDAAGHVNFTVWSAATGASVLTVDTAVAASTASCLAIFSSEATVGNRTILAYEDLTTHDYSFMVYDENGAQIVAPVAFHSLGAANAAGKCSIGFKADASATTVCVAMSYSGAITPSHTVVGEFDYSTGAVVGTNTTVWYSRLASTLKSDYKESYFVLYSEMDWSAYGTNKQPAAFLCCRTLGYSGTRAFHVVAHALSGYAHETTPDAYDLGKLCNLSQDTSGNFYWASPYTTTSSSTSQKQAAGVSFMRSHFLNHCRLDSNHLVTGGWLAALGNSTIHENGFLQYPVISSLATSTPGGSMSDGTYSVVVVFEYTDEDGQLHRSAPSLPVSITLSAGGAGQLITVNVKTCLLGHPGKYTSARYVAYRTTNGGATYYNTQCFCLPTTTTATSAITVTPSDASIAAYDTLYTTGSPSVLDSIAPPSPWMVTKGPDRAFVLSADDRAEVWYSKPKEEGIASEFSDSLIIRFPEPLDAIWMYNSKLYGFSESSVWVVTGDGPSATGQGGQFSTPAMVSSTNGRVNPMSLVETPVGLMFQTANWNFPLDPYSSGYLGGIWMINDSGLSPVLPPVDYNDYLISSARTIPKKNQVVFTLYAYPSENALLVYDYVAGQWSVHKIPEAGNTYANGDVVNGLHQFSGRDNWYSQASTLTYLATDTIKVRTPWIKVGGQTAGYGRVRWVYLLGTYKSAHTLNIKVYYDYESTTAAETITQAITATQTPYLYRFKPARQRCTAIMLEIYDSNQAGTYESFSLDGVMLSVGKKPRQVLPAARTL